MVRRRSGPPRIRSTDTDLGRALEAMTAPELRAFVRAVLDEFEDEQRSRVIDSLGNQADNQNGPEDSSHGHVAFLLSNLRCPLPSIPGANV